MNWKDLFEKDEFVRDIAKSIDRIVKKNFPRITSDEKADISQEILQKIWKMIAGGKKIDNLRSYIWRVTYTTALDFLNDKMKYVNVGGEKELDGAESLKSGVALSLESRLERKQSKEALLASIEGVSPNRRIILKLSLTGMTVNEIAKFLGWSVSKVNHLYYRGLEDLRKRMKAEEEVK